MRRNSPSVAYVAAFAERVQLFCAARRGSRCEKRAGGHLRPHLIEMGFEDQRKRQLLSVSEHHVEMRTAKALFVCFFSYIRLHHRSSEDEIELIRLVFAVKLAERASAFAYVRIDVPGGAFFERLVHRDRINLFHVLFLSGRSVRPSTFTVYSIHYRCANFKCRDRVSRKRRCFSYDNRECRKLFRDKDV